MSGTQKDEASHVRREMVRNMAWTVVIYLLLLGVIVVVLYAMSRGVIPSPIRPSRVELADKNYRCNECGKTIKKGLSYYHCTCGRRSHTKCAKRAELCECLRRVRLDQ